MGNIKSILIIFTLASTNLMDCLDAKSKEKIDKTPNQNSLYQFFENLKLQFGISVISVITALTPNTLMAQEIMDSTGLKELVTAYQEVWNTHDATEVARFFAEDADMVLGNFPASNGREAIEAWWESYFYRQELERCGWFEVTSIKFLSPVTALVNLVSTTGIVDDTSTYRKARGTWFVNKNSGQWMISALQGLPTTEDRVELIASMETAERLHPIIRAFVANYEETYNHHNPEALSQFYTVDADIIVREQPVIQGTDAIKAWWQKYFSQPRPFQALFIVDDIRMLSDDVAILNFTITGATPAMQNQLVPVREARATWIIVRKDGKWLITSLRVLPSIYDRVIRH